VPDTPKAEQISAAAETLIRTISTANGYNYDYVNLGDDVDIRVVESLNEVNEFPRLYLPADDEAQAGAFTAGQVETTKNERELKVLVVGYVEIEDSDTALNKVRQDIERAMFSTGQTLGLNFVTALVTTTVLKHQDRRVGNNRAAIGVTFVATYRYTRGDP